MHIWKDTFSRGSSHGYSPKLHFLLFDNFIASLNPDLSSFVMIHNSELLIEVCAMLNNAFHISDTKPMMPAEVVDALLWQSSFIFCNISPMLLFRLIMFETVHPYTVSYSGKITLLLFSVILLLQLLRRSHHERPN